MIPVRALFILCLCALSGTAAELRTLSGKSVSGELVSISDQQIVLSGPAGTVATPLADVLQLDLVPAAPLPGTAKYTLVELTDGSLLNCSQLALKGKQAELTLLAPDGGNPPPPKIQLPLAAIATVLNDAQDPAVRQEWQQNYLRKRANQDILALKTKDTIQRFDGTFGEPTEAGDKISFQLPKKTYEIDLARVQGMIFVRKTDPDTPAPVCKVHDLYRNVLAARKVELDQGGFVVTTVSGARVEYPRQLVARLDYSKGKLTYLSDLEPAKVIEKSNLDWVEHYRRDKNLDGGDLRLAGQKYSKGLALHSYTELIYDIDGGYKEFKAVLGVDDLVGGDGKAVVKIDADGRELFSGTITRKDPLRPLNLDVTGVKLLRIVVRSSGFLDLGDHVDLADAKVSK
jgi:hypothetical protein